MKKLLHPLILLVFTSYFSIGQKKIVFQGLDSLNNSKEFQKIWKNSESMGSKKAINEGYDAALQKGYFLCEVIPKSFSDECDTFQIRLGPKFKGLSLAIPDSSFQLLSDYISNPSTLSKKSKSLMPQEYLDWMHSILNDFNNKGFPFFRMKLVPVKNTKEELMAELDVELGPYVSWIKIHQKNDSVVSLNTLQSIIGIHIGEAFNESALESIEQRVNQTDIFLLKKKCEVLFTTKGAELFVYLERTKSSAIQGIIGFQPDPATNKPVFTGDLQLKLLNSLKFNESFQLVWKSIQPKSQSLQTNVLVPYLFKSSFGFLGDFQLYKRDSSFLDVKSSLGFQYSFQNGWQLRAQYQSTNSSLLSAGNVNPMFTKLANIRSHTYGITLLRSKLDYQPNPMKGFMAYFEGQIGERKRMGMMEGIWKTRINFSFYQPLATRMTLFTQLQFDTYHAPSIFQNELFRFGGTNSLRGFNEESLFATTKAVITMEYRYLLDRNSTIFAFFNQAFYENTAINYQKGSPYGFGVGISAGTNLGIFRLSYALGAVWKETIQLNSGKIHIGYISYF